MVLSLAAAGSLVRLYLAQPGGGAHERRVALDRLMRRLARLPEAELPNLLADLGVPISTCHGGRWSRLSRLRRWLEQQGTTALEEPHGLRNVSRAASASPRVLGE